MRVRDSTLLAIREIFCLELIPLPLRQTDSTKKVAIFKAFLVKSCMFRAVFGRASVGIVSGRKRD